MTLLAVFKKERTFVQYELLKRYGSPARIGTNHLVFSDLEFFAEIYSKSSNPCLKDGSCYDGLSATGVVNILNAVDRGKHARLRRLVSHSFSVKSLLESEAVIQAKVEAFMNAAFQVRKGQSTEIFNKIYELSLDIVSQLSFGQPFDYLSGKNTNANHDVQALFVVVPTMSWLPWMRYMPIKSFQEGPRGLARLH